MADRPTQAPRHRPMISRDFLEDQRRRNFAAGTAELADEFGTRAITVTMLCQVGHSARNTFYELFASGAECMRFTAAQGYEALFASTPEPDSPARPGPAEVTGALCEAAAAEPALVRFLLVHSRAVAMGEGDRSVESAVRRLADLLASCRGGESAGPREDFVARVYVEMLGRRLIAEDPGAVAALPAELDPWALGLLEPARGR